LFRCDLSLERPVLFEEGEDFQLSPCKVGLLWFIRKGVPRSP
jgi:hypothetical protein